MIALSVEFAVDPAHADAFRSAVMTQAANSLSREPGCLRFDVCTDPERPERFFLYEVYSDEEAVTAHRETPHYARYAATVQDWVEKKTLAQWRILSSDGSGPGTG